MKKLLIAGALALTASCATLFAPADMIPVGPDSPVTRLTERVVSRHDAYVLAVEEPDRKTYMAESALALSIVQDNLKVQVDALARPLRPVLARYDRYVLDDASLDGLEREIYLGTSTRLSSLLDQAEKGRKDF